MSETQGRTSKAQRIRALDDGTRSVSQIAAEVGCRSEYVRVVLRQRTTSGMSNIDRRYLAKPGVAEKKRVYDRDRKRALAAARRAQAGERVQGGAS